MIFNSYIFILLFLPFTVSLFYIFRRFAPWRLCIGFLCLISLIFYCCDSPKNILILLASIAFNYLIQKKIFSNKEKIFQERIYLAVGIILNVMILFYFKYYGFFFENVNRIFNVQFSIKQLALPLGISFITFQQIAFLVDTYRGKIGNIKFLDYICFITYFPHISSGPILLYQDFEPFLHKKKEVDWNKIAQGFYMFAMGLGKKVLIADVFGQAVNYGYANVTTLNTTTAIFVSIAYSIEIYFDFSGYCDMAIGISRMLQMDLPQNFDSPYQAVTILEFWKKWHITLTRFLTQYLYIPLGGNRKGKLRANINTIIVFACSGLWHGASWTFVLWGLIHGCFMVITKSFKGIFDKIPKMINRIITLSFVNLAWVLFRSSSWDTFKQMIQAIFQNKWGKLDNAIGDFFKPAILEAISISWIPSWVYALVATAVVMFMLFGCRNVQYKAEHLNYSVKSVVWVLAVLIISVCSFSGVTTFIYAAF